MPLFSLALLEEKHIRWSPLVSHIDLILTHSLPFWSAWLATLILSLNFLPVFFHILIKWGLLKRGRGSPFYYFFHRKSVFCFYYLFLLGNISSSWQSPADLICLPIFWSVELPWLPTASSPPSSPVCSQQTSSITFKIATQIFKRICEVTRSLEECRADIIFTFILLA